MSSSFLPQSRNGEKPTRYALHTFLGAMLFWYGGGFLRAQFEYIYNWTEIIEALATFIASLFLGYLVFRRSRIFRPTPWPLVTVSDISHAKVFLCLSLLLVVYVFGLSRGGMIGYHTTRLIPVTGIIAGIILFSGINRMRAVYLLYFLAPLIYSLTIYSRRPALTIVAVPIILYWINWKTTKKLIAPILVGVVAGVAILIVQTGLRQAKRTSAGISARLQFTDGLTALSVGEGFDTIAMFDYVIDNYPARYDFLNQKSIYGTVLNFVPREFWPEKPIGFGVELAGNYFGLDISDLATNFGPGIVAEAFANGGLLSVFAWGLATGLLLYRLDSFLSRRSSDLIRATVAAISLPAIAFIVRGDLLNGVYELFIKLLPALLVFYVTARKVATPNRGAGATTRRALRVYRA